MSLYEINKDLQNALVFDEETGELIETEEFKELQLKREAKIENIGLLVKNLKADAKAIKDEEEALKVRRTSIEKKIEVLTKYLSANVDTEEEIRTSKIQIKFRKSEVVSVDESVLPKKWFTKKITLSPNKVEIKKYIKSGKTVKGATINTNYNLQIK